MSNILKQKVGILGGGQLGKMLVQAGSKLGYPLYILEKNKDFPTPKIWPNVIYGDFTRYEDVMAFGSEMDIITVEIEAVNTQALHDLVAQGKKVYPQPDILDTIKDKGLQKSFYQDSGFPTSDFILSADKSEVLSLIESGNIKLPFVQKSRTDGYDGKGVTIIKAESDFDQIFDVPSVIEDLVDIETEISIIVARNPKGEVQSFPAVEMMFHPTANLVEFLISPSKISEDLQERCKRISEALVQKMGIVGLLAVELFVTKSGEVLINEVAPRPHNSGHHTIEANATSQYEQHIRAIMNLPLGKTDILSPVAMVNILGHPDHTGDASYDGLEECLQIPEAHIHLYGKTTTKPFRKMGHATVVARSLEDAIKRARILKDRLHVISK